MRKRVSSHVSVASKDNGRDEPFLAICTREHVLDGGSEHLERVIIGRRDGRRFREQVSSEDERTGRLFLLDVHDLLAVRVDVESELFRDGRKDVNETLLDGTDGAFDADTLIDDRRDGFGQGIGLGAAVDDVDGL